MNMRWHDSKWPMCAPHARGLFSHFGLVGWGPMATVSTFETKRHFSYKAAFRAHAWQLPYGRNYCQTVGRRNWTRRTGRCYWSVLSILRSREMSMRSVSVLNSELVAGRNADGPMAARRHAMRIEEKRNCGLIMKTYTSDMNVCAAK